MSNHVESVDHVVMSNQKLATLHAKMIHFDIGLFTLILLPFLLIIEKFIAPKTRGHLWRAAAVWIVKTTFAHNQIIIKTLHRENIRTNDPVIYAVNHPSEMDAFYLLTILGPNNIFFIAPLKQFNPLLATWLKKMEAVSVRRDSVDDKRYPHDHTKQKAIKLAIHRLHQGKSLLIFPEGHIELLHVLHYFHTGAARISLGSHTPIIPVSICNADKVFPDGHHVFPGLITISFGRPIEQPRKFSNYTNYSKIKTLALRNKIEKAIVDHLPSRYLPEFYHLETKKIGVFLDIDRTVYAGFSQKDLVKYLFQLHKVNYADAFKIFYWLFLEKIHELKHRDLMRKSLLILRGWDIGELNHVVDEIFHQRMIKNIQYGLLPIIKDHAENGHSIVFVSEVIHPLAQEFKNFFQGRATLDTRLEAEHHHYTGDVDCLCYKEEKARLLQEFAERTHIDLNKSYAYADSGSDIPFLKLVKHPVAINPDEKLLTYAQRHKFTILEDAS